MERVTTFLRCMNESLFSPVKVMFLKLLDTAPRQKNNPKRHPVQMKTRTNPGCVINISPVLEEDVVLDPRFLRFKSAWKRRVERDRMQKLMMVNCQDSCTGVVRSIFDSTAAIKFEVTIETKV
jgi:hypothetical protein